MFHLQLINSLEGLGMFFSSAALIRRLRKYTATVLRKFEDFAESIIFRFYPNSDLKSVLKWNDTFVHDQSSYFFNSRIVISNR